MIRFILWACIAHLIMASSQVLAESLTLAEAQTLAVKNSPHLGVLHAEAVDAQSKATTAGLQNRPVVGVAAGGQFEGNADERRFLPLAYAYAGVNLYNGDQSRIQSTMASLEVDKTLLVIPAREFHIKKEIEEIFAAIALRSEKETLKQKELDLFESHRKKAMERQRAGLIGESDVLEFELRKADIQRDMGTLKIEKDEYLKQLVILTGKERIDGIAGYQLPTAMDVPKLKEGEQAGGSVSGKALAIDLSSITLEKDLQKAKWGPKLDLEGRAGRLPSEGELDPYKPRFDIMIVAKLDLFNDSQKRADLQQALARGKKIEALIHAEKSDISNSVERVLAGMESIRRKVRISEKNRQAANRYYKSTVSEYERGIKNSPDVAHATEILFEGDYRDIELRYDWAKEKAALERLLSKNL